MTYQPKRTAQKSAARTKHGGKIVLKYAKIILVLLVFLSILLLIVRPYKRIERRIRQTLSERAPAIKIGALDVRFPLHFTLTDLEVPLKINNQERRLHMEELKGNLSILPLLKGQANAEMKSDFLGGTLWVKVQSEQSEDPLLVFDARARQLDLQQVSEFVQAPARISGRCNIDVEGNMKNEKLDSITGDGLCVASNVEIPPLDLHSLVLPANHTGEGKAKITAQKGLVSIQDCL